MSIGLLDSPLGLSPVNNPVPLVVSSSFAEEDGFRFKIELLDSSYDKILETWIYPDTDNNNYGIYDFSMILGDLIGSNVYYDITGITAADDSKYKFNWRATEYIGSTSGATLASTYPIVFRGVKQYGDFWDANDYISGNTFYFLSNKQKREYKLDEYGTINAFYGNFGAYQSIWTRVVYELNDGSKFYTLIISPDNNFYGGSIYSIPVGPVQLNEMGVGGVLYNYSTDIATSSSILDSDDDYYNIYIQSGTTTLSETIRVDLKHTCNRYEGVELLWLGDLSTYETYTFRMADLKSFKTKRNEIKSNYYDLNSSGKYTYSVGTRGRKNVNIRTTESHKIYTDWIKDEEAHDLMELFRSNDVYIIDGGLLYPIIITDTSYSEKVIKNDRLFNYSLSFELAYEKYSNV